MWQLIINGPGYFDTAYEVREGVTQVGRADENDIVLSGDLVSRKHARFHLTGEHFELEDLGSRNGIKLNEVPASGTTTLKPGDVVTVGENSLAVRQLRVNESLDTEMVDMGAGGQVKRFGRGIDIREAVVMAREIGESNLLRALDSLVPFETGKNASSGDTDESELNAATGSGDREQSGAVAVESLVLLYRIAEALARARGLQEFLDETCDLVMKRVVATTGVVLLRHRTGVMVPAAVRHSKKLQRGEVPVSDAIIDAALAQGRAIAVADVRDDARFADRESVVLYGIDQVLCIPIGAGAPFLGVLYLNRTSVSKETVDALLDICTAITQLLQTGIERFRAEPTQAQDDKVKKLLERYHGPEVVERRLTELKMAGVKLAQLEERQATAVHVELVGLKAQPGKASLEGLVHLLAEFQKLCTQLFFSFEGTVTGFEGDACKALFGAPYQRGDDGIRAVRAAMALKAEWERHVKKLPVKERYPVRIGLNTGKVIAGTTGNEQRLDYHVFGEVPSVAALLAASGEPGQVLITGKTLASIGARFDVTPLGERALHGSRVRTAVFEVVDEDSDSGTLSGVR